MAGFLTFLDLKKFENTSGYDLVEENVRLSPELEVFPAETMEATSIELTVRTDLPTVNFSNIGEGVPGSKSGYITKLFQNANLDALVKLPVNLLSGKPQAIASRLMTAEQNGFVEAAVRKIGAQTWYGTKSDAKGFVGLLAQMGTGASYTVDAGANAAKSSIYFVSVGLGKLDYWFGSNRTLQFDDWNQQTVHDANGLDMEALISWMHCNVGMRLANRNALVRVKNIGANNDAGHTATFDHMYAALEQMRDDLGQIPTHILMTGRTQEQLRDSLKTDLNPNPPLPKEFEGIPIKISHNISNAETI